MTKYFLGSTIFFLACVALTAAGVPQARAAGQYDLAITSFSVSPTQGTVNTRFTYYVTIQNVGNTPAPLKGLNFMRNDDVMQSSGTQPWGSQPTTLNPGQSQQYSLNYVFGAGTATGSGTMPPGRQIIKATINNFYLADDFNPDNNSLYVQAEVANPNGTPLGWPDLRIKEIKTTCGGMVATGLNREVNAGSTVKVTVWTLENSGSQPAFLPKGLLLLRATEKGQPMGEYVVNKSHIMKAGQGFLYDLEIPGSKLTKAGPHEIIVSSDPSKAVQESSDFNNDIGFFITVKGPDLAVTGVTASPAQPDTRQSIALSVTVKNLSTGQAVYCPQGPVFLTYGPQGKTYQAGAPANFTLAAGQEYRTAVHFQPRRLSIHHRGGRRGRSEPCEQRLYPACHADISFRLGHVEPGRRCFLPGCVRCTCRISEDRAAGCEPENNEHPAEPEGAGRLDTRDRASEGNHAGRSQVNASSMGMKKFTTSDGKARSE